MLNTETAESQQAAQCELEAIKSARKSTRDREDLDPQKILATLKAVDRHRRPRKIEKQLKEQ